MVACDFPISAPGLVHLSTMLIGIVCVTLGFMTHLHSSWVNKSEYKVCTNASNYWKNSTDVNCPDISLETSFLIIVVLCLTTSFLWYYCELCCFSGSKSATLFYVIYLLLAAVACIAGGILYIKSAILIARLPSPNVMPVIKNMGRVLYATFTSEQPDEMTSNLTKQTDEQTYYQEKLATGALTLINGILHVMCAWLAVIDFRHQNRQQ